MPIPGSQQPKSPDQNSESTNAITEPVTAPAVSSSAGVERNMTAETRSQVADLLQQAQLSFNRTELDEQLQPANYTPTALLKLFSRQFGKEYQTKLGLGSGEFTIGDHTRMVLQQFDRYLAHEELPMKVDSSLFRVIVALHDLGKAQAIEEGDAGKQHQYTPAIVQKTLQELQYPPEQIQIAVALCGEDPLGVLFKNRLPEKGAEMAFQKLKSLSEKLKAKLEDIYQLFLAFYKADASSYTVKAGFKRFLDELFVFQDQYRQIEFATKAQDRIDLLEEKIYQ